MLKSGKLKKINAGSFRFRLGVAAFVLGIGLGYSITDDKSPTEQLTALSARVKNILFVKTADPRKDG